MEEKQPLVSVIIPMYNCAAYLPKLFASLRSQTYPNLEIICVDDGSTDASSAIATQFIYDDYRIRIFRKYNSGAGETRNAGIVVAKGDYICFVDADDFIAPNAIELLVDTAENHGVDVVLFDLDNYSKESNSFTVNESINREYVPVRQVFKAVDVPNIYKHVIGFTVNKFYRADFLRENNLLFPKIAAHEDMPFTYLALSLADGIYYLDETLYHYRRENQDSVSNTLETDYQYMFQALEITCDWLFRHKIWKKFEKDFISYVLHMCSWQYSRKNILSRTEFLETAAREWFSKLGVAYLSPQDVHDLSDYQIYEKAMSIGKAHRFAAEFYRSFSRAPAVVKAVILFRTVRGRLAKFIRRRQKLRELRAIMRR
ncbi:glycosyltransferase [Arcanobacterium hippocoleae]